MDIVLRQMIDAHHRWLFMCRFVYGHEQGDLMYLATAAFMRLPIKEDVDG